MQTTHIKRVFGQHEAKKQRVAEALKVTPKHLNNTLRIGTDVYIVHEGTKSLTAFKAQVGNVL